MEIQIIADPVNYNKNVQVYILIDIASEIYPFLRWTQVEFCLSETRELQGCNTSELRTNRLWQQKQKILTDLQSFWPEDWEWLETKESQRSACFLIVSLRAGIEDSSKREELSEMEGFRKKRELLNKR